MYDLQYGSDFPDHLHIQETIDYCETRFRVILSAFACASDSQQHVIQHGLHKELVTISLSYTFLLDKFSLGIFVIIYQHVRRHWPGH